MKIIKKKIIKKSFFYNKKNLNYKKLTKKKIHKNTYLYKNKKLKKGIFLKKPKFKEILYPIFLNLKLVNQYLKKN